mmetsp:Transcript_18948/g.44111  ORF Transcript_18948/g.44111 Transcript_18948/m.44111 type:complete len:1051 (+) Transcript_18948:81-3233(+)
MQPSKGRTPKQGVTPAPISSPREGTKGSTSPKRAAHDILEPTDSLSSEVLSETLSETKERHRLKSEGSKDDALPAADAKKKSTASSSGESFKRITSPSTAISSAVAKVSAKEFSSGDSGSGKKPHKKGEENTRIRDFPRSQQKAVVLDKLHNCNVLYDFTSNTRKSDKESKRMNLMQLIDYISAAKHTLDEETVCLLVSMLKANVLRGLKVSDRNPMDFLMEAEDESASTDPAWFHLEHVYDLFSKVVTSRGTVDVKIVQREVGTSFVRAVFEYLDSDDARERDALKTLVQQMYSKLSKLRDAIIGALRYELTKTVYERESHRGVKELLELASDLTKGFSSSVLDIKVPKDFLTRILLPMHKLYALNEFHSCLVTCIKKYVELDARLTYVIITKLLKVWPVAAASKQVLYLDEIEEMLKMTPQIQFRRMQESLVRRIALCIESPHYQVAERALLLWNTEGFVKLVNQNARSLLPHLIGPLSKTHWFQAVNQRLPNVVQLLKETNQTVYQDSVVASEKEIQKKAAIQAAREEKWAALQSLFESRKGAPPAAPSAAQQRKTSPAKTGEGRSKPSRRESVDHGETPASDAKEFWGENSLSSSAPLSADKSKKSSKRGCLKVASKLECLSLREERYGVAVRWQDTAATSTATWDLQAVLVDGKGDIVDAVHSDRTSACQAAVRQLQFSSEESGGKKLARNDYHSIMWVTLPRVPLEVDLLVFLLSVDFKVTTEQELTGMVHLFAGDRFHDIARFKVDYNMASVGGLVAIQRRPVPSTTASPRSEVEKDAQVISDKEPNKADLSWSLARLEGSVRQGHHFMHVWEPWLGDLVRACLPKVPKAQRLTLPLENSSCVDLPTATAAKWLFIGVAWDLLPPNIVESFRLDVAALLFDDSGKQVGTIAPTVDQEHDQVTGEQETPGLLSAGVILDWENITSKVTQIYIIGNVAQAGLNLRLVHNISATVVDPSGTNLIRLHFTNASADETGIIIARVLRDGSPGDRCRFQALGQYCNGRNWSESLPDVHPLLESPADALLSADHFRSNTQNGRPRFRMSL